LRGAGGGAEGSGLVAGGRGVAFHSGASVAEPDEATHAAGQPAGVAGSGAADCRAAGCGTGVGTGSGGVATSGAAEVPVSVAVGFPAATAWSTGGTDRAGDAAGTGGAVHGRSAGSSAHEVPLR